MNESDDILDQYNVPEDLDEEKKEEIRKVLKKGRNYDIGRVLNRLLISDPFFSAVSRRIIKRKNQSIPTAGVRWDEDRMNFALEYNPYFMAQLDADEQRAVVKHEFYHVVLKHVTGRMHHDEEDQEAAKRWNYATDCAINSIPDLEEPGNLPDFALHPDKFDLPSNQAAEYYNTHLPDEATEQEEGECPVCDGEGEISKQPPSDGQQGDGDDEEQQQAGGDGEQQGSDDEQQQAGQQGEKESQQNGGGGQSEDQQAGGDGDQEKVPCPACSGHGQKEQFDEHNWGSAQEDKNAADQEIERVAKEARDEVAKQDSWGKVPSEIRKAVEEMLESEIRWRDRLSYFIQKTQKADKKRSIRQINRKKHYRRVHPGFRYNRESNLAISIDQSGSVSDKILLHFFSELKSLSDRVSFTVIPFDAQVSEDEIFRWEKNQVPELERVAQGGTNFEAPTRWVNEQGNFDGHIIMTDMYAPKPQPSHVQRAWVKPKKCKPNFNTDEMVIEIDTDKLGDS